MRRSAARIDPVPSPAGRVANSLVLAVKIVQCIEAVASVVVTEPCVLELQIRGKVTVGQTMGERLNRVTAVSHGCHLRFNFSRRT
ncbi:hypothetical protein X989_4467 [Burkholderia pseudomallei MSHR4378]|nr:hypothetical protein X989_4467 [Burkholderia pseudomallei MSHR4378]